MKKLLALVLALVMTLSLCVTSNAAFTDAADIEHTEAVEVLSALGVINGKPNGGFDPKGTVTRAEMAKMITIVMLGDVDAAAFVGTTTDLKDVNGHWAEGYIKYCYSQGVIAGKGNGVFDPNANVTAAEAAKMLLVAIGFDAKIQEYVGADWAINVTRDAQVKSFYTELKGLVAGEALTRDKAAQMIWNAVQAEGVEVRKGWNSEDNKITYSYANTDPLLEATFSVTTKEGVLNDSVYQTSGANKGTYTVDVGGNTYTKVAADYSDLLGQEVKVLFYDKNGNGGFNSADDSVYGIYAKYDNAATETFLLSAVEKTGDKKIKVNGNTYALDDTVILWTVAVNGTIATSTITAAELEDNDSLCTARLVDWDDDAKYDLAVVYAANYAKVTYVDSTKVIAGASTYKLEDYVVADTLAKNDFVALTWNFAKGTTELAEIEKQTGKVTAFKTNYVKVDGGEWVYATGMAIDQTYDYYVLNGVVVDKTQTTAVALENLVFVSGTSDGLTGTTARVYYTDGTNEVVNVDTTSTGATPPTPYNFYTVSETSNGIKFKALSAYTSYQTKSAIFTDYTYTNAGTVATTSSKISTISSKSIADDAVVFVYSGTNTTAKVITGKQLKTLDAAAATAGKIGTPAVGSFFKTVNGLDKVVIAAVSYQDATLNTWANWGLSADADNYALVTSKPITIASGYYQYSIWTGTENVTVIDKTYNPAKFSVVAYSEIDADGYIKDVSVKAYDATAYSAGAGEYASAALTGFETTKTGYNLTLNGTPVVTTDKDTIFWSINSAADTADGIGLNKLEAADAIVLADKVVDVYCQNVLVYTGTSGAADVVIFDATNRLATAAATTTKLSTINAKITVTDVNGDLVGTTTDLKAGDILTVKVASGGYTLTAGAGLKFANTGAAVTTTENFSAGEYTLIVTGAATPCLN